MSNVDPSPFHDGERAMQAECGLAARMEETGRKVIRSFMPAQHRQFFAQLPFLLLGARDAEGQPWASLLAGPVGFVASPDDRTLDIAAGPAPGDPLAAHLRQGASVGLLGIEPHTRRRNRANGTLTAAQPGRGLTVAVQQSFGNCPKYINARAPRFRADLAALSPPPAMAAAELADLSARIVAEADTLFIASAYQAEPAVAGHGVDVSHRGGRPGFVERLDATTLRFPDYRGNFLFNTLGNLLRQPRCGLLFLDFDTGALVHLAGRAAILRDPAILGRYPGAERAVEFHIERVLFRPRAIPLDWHFLEPAPQFAAADASR
ncbi:MAG: flavin-nucleotide-binding protein [Alphaproteobacteria bacterium]|nr:flavin-nucleotide-binding protein [Alphaproteobacteria bacterium]